MELVARSQVRPRQGGEPATVQDRFVVVDGVRVRYRVSGCGPPVLLLHGIVRSLEDWAEQQDLLADRFQAWSLDLPGYGRSDPLPGAHTVPALARAVLGFLDAVQVTEPVHLAGNSLGGAIAMTVAVLAPTRVRSLVLVDSAGFGRQVTPALRLLAVRPLRSSLLQPSRARARQVERLLFTDAAYATPARVDLALTLARRAHGSRVLLETAQSLGTVLGVRPYWRRALLAAVARLDVPVLIVWGTRDRVLPAPHREAISRALPRARVHAFAGAGHMPQIERAQAFHDLVEAFWARLEAGSPAREEAPAR